MTEAAPKLNRTTIVRQVSDDLRDRIKEGDLSAGTKMPSESECCRIYGVSRATVRQAYQLLEQEGLIETKHGYGRFVLPGATIMVQGSVNLVQSTTRILEDSGYRPSIEVLGVHERTANSREAEVFNLARSAPVIEVERAYVHERQLLTHSVNVLDASSLPHSKDDMDWSQSLARTYATAGREIFSGVTDISAALLPERLHRDFDVPSGSAWLKFDGPLYDQNGQPLWWSHELWRDDVRSLRVVNRREPKRP